MAVEKLDKDLKELAIGIIEANGKTYEEWLNEQHKNLIFSNVKIIKEGLNLIKEVGD